MMEKIERIGRKCYKSEDKIGPGTAEPFVRMLLKRGHFAMIEHVSVTALLVCDRGVTHELVRHRVASYAQESSRYCNYGGDRFGNEITVTLPHWGRDSLIDKPQYRIWERAMGAAEGFYLEWIAAGGRAEDARSVLPTGLKTEIYVTMNLREWLYVFSLRTAPDAHPDMRVVMHSLRDQFKTHLPVFFEEDWFRPGATWRKIVQAILKAESLTEVQRIAREALSLPADGTEDSNP
jgi:thymidylate synthase (FAD)